MNQIMFWTFFLPSLHSVYNCAPAYYPREYGNTNQLERYIATKGHTLPRIFIMDLLIFSFKPKNCKITIDKIASIPNKTNKVISCLKNHQSAKSLKRPLQYVTRGQKVITFLISEYLSKFDPLKKVA